MNAVTVGSMKSRNLVIYCALVLLIGWVRPTLGQTSTGTITGQVLDSTQAIVTSAPIVVTNTDTGVVRTLTTDSAGLYRASDLIPGHYSVQAKVSGFATQQRTQVLLSIGETVSINFQLQPSAVDQTVSVAASSAGNVDTSTSVIQDEVSQQQVQDLPLLNRSFFSLIGLSAGAIQTPEGGFDINGGRQEGNLFLIDGLDVVPQSSAVVNIQLNLDALQEFQVQTSNFTAEYGRSIGGIVNAHVKSGTNSYHGSLFEYVQNDKLNSCPKYSCGPGYITPPIRYNQFGGSVGGKLIRDKLFFFGDYQGTRNNSSGTSYSSVPTKAFGAPNAAGNYDYSSLCTAGFTAAGLCKNPAQQIYNPYTSTAGAAPTRTAFSNNLIPASLADKVSAYALAQLPAPNYTDPTGASNFRATSKSVDPQNSWDLRFDYNPRASDQIGVSFTYIGTHVGTPSVYGPNIGSGFITGVAQGTYVLGLISETHEFTPGLANTISFGIPVQRYDGPRVEGDQYISSLANIGALNTDASNIYTTGLPLFINFDQFSIFGGPLGGPFIQSANTPQFADNLSWQKGRHALRMGGIGRWREFNNLQNSTSRGLYLFNATETSNAGTGGNGFASILLGSAFSAQRALDFVEKGRRIKEFGAYFQDDFKANQRLTLNMGLRWDLFKPLTEVHGDVADFSLVTKQLIFPGNGVSASTVDTNWHNFQPRVGFAYSPNLDGRTSIRGGYGISFLPLQYQATADYLTTNYPTSFSTSRQTANPNGQPDLLVSNGLPIVKSGDPAVIAPNASVVYMPKHQVTPYIQQYNLGIQQQLPHDIAVVEAVYVGNVGVHITGDQNLNQWAPGTSQAASPISPNIGTVEGLLNDEQSNYNSLQLKAKRNFSQGVALQASYTWSRSIDNGSAVSLNNGNSPGLAQNSFNLAAERGPSDFNVKNRFVGSFSYALPFGIGKAYMNSNHLLDAVAGGWQLNSIISAQSGLPFTVYTASGDSGINAGSGGGVRPNQVGDPFKPGPVSANPGCNGYTPPTKVGTLAAWYNPCAFVQPVNQFGNTSRNSITAPGSFNWDASLFKSFAIYRESRLEFRSEFFNILNHPNPGLPDQYFNSNSGNTTPTSQIMSASAQRRIQLALRLSF